MVLARSASVVPRAVLSLFGFRAHPLIILLHWFQSANLDVQICYCLQVSTGKLNVTNITPTAATMSQLTTPLTCLSQQDGSIAVLPSQQTAVCTGSYTFDQTAFESGARVFTANFTTGNVLGTSFVPASIMVVPQEQPSVLATIAESSCVMPSQAGKCGLANGLQRTSSGL